MLYVSSSEAMPESKHRTGNDFPKKKNTCFTRNRKTNTKIMFTCGTKIKSKIFPIAINTKHSSKNIFVNKKTSVHAANMYDRCLLIPRIENIELGQVLNNNSYKESFINDEADCRNNNFEKCIELFKNNSKFVKIINFNAQGFFEGAHYEQICLYNKDINADVIAVSETWLNKNINNGLVNIDGYKLMRSDRNFKKTNVIKGGGGCAFVRDNFKAKYIAKSNGSQFTLIDFPILEIQSRGTKFLMCNLYRHGDCPDEE